MKSYRSQSLVLPFRSWFLMGSAAAFMGASLTLAVLSSRNQPATVEFKHAVGDAATPIVGAVSKPAELLNGIGDRLRQLMTLDEENRRLREENADLLHWQTAAERLETENAALRGLLTMRAVPGMTFVTARVVTGDGSAFSHSLRLAEGTDEGLARDQAVITERGLVGRIIDAGRSSSQVLLLTDLNSRLPVEVIETGRKAILVGDNSGHPQLKFDSGDAAPVAGQHVVTAADGGVFPAGFAVGIIRTVKGDAVSVTPFVDPSRLGYVRSVVVK